MAWDVQGNYDYGHGWEHVDSAGSEEDAYKAMQTYRDNEPGVRFRVVMADDYSFDYGAAAVALRQIGN